MSNYGDVLLQLRSLGIIVDRLEVDSKIHRCRTEDAPREKKGWYKLHHWTDRNSNDLVVGSFGVWQGDDANAQKVKLDRSIKLSDDEKTAIRLRMQQDRKAAQVARAKEAERASRRAAGVWAKSLTTPPDGTTEYLSRKGVQAHGLRYSDTGSLIIPMQDNSGTVKGLQFILPAQHPRKKKTGRDKEFWPRGMAMRGSYFLIGGSPAPVMLIAEGYATAATLFEATGLPVAVAFNANNLLPVAENLRKRFPDGKFLIAADDDYLQKCKSCGERTDVNASSSCSHCHAEHRTDNPGTRAANIAALAVGGFVVSPTFPADRGGKKLTDFNDLQHFPAGGIALVQHQVESALEKQGWTNNRRANSPQPGAGGDIPAMLTLDEGVDRYSLVYGGNSTFFDHEDHILINKQDVLDIMPDHAWRDWKMRPDRKVVRMTEVGFDPSETDPEVKCNLYGGWPTEPKKGSCEKLLQLLEYLCMNEENDQDTFNWVLKWLAYPVQNPGAKMKTALVFHGPQGTGKNLFFESVMKIYGEYGRIVDQAAIEDKFNDWASKKLFLIADEVVARQELFHQKNKLKALITGDTIRINPKNLAAHEEENHLNMVFLSNERQPLVLESWDRRYMVVWTPDKLPQDYYTDIAAEIHNGGIEALHDYLVNLELGEFNPHTKPLQTKAKNDLTSLSLDSIEWFIKEWKEGDLGLPFCPAGSVDVYTEYQRWCKSCGVRYPRDAAQFAGYIKKLEGWRYDVFYVFDNLNFAGGRKRKRMFYPDEKEMLGAAANSDLDRSKYREKPHDVPQQQWLTSCRFAFANARNNRDEVGYAEISA